MSFLKANKKRKLLCDVIAETLFSVRFHSCEKQLRKKILKNNMSSSEYEDNVYESQENFFKENTDSDINELNDLIGNLHPYRSNNARAFFLT